MGRDGWDWRIEGCTGLALLLLLLLLLLALLRYQRGIVGCCIVRRELVGGLKLSKTTGSAWGAQLLSRRS